MKGRLRAHAEYRVANRRDLRLRVDGAAPDEIHLPEDRHLHGRVIDHWPYLVIEPEPADVTGDANHCPCAIAEAAHNDRLANGIVVRPIQPRERFADDDDRWGVWSVGFREVAPTQRNAHRRKIAGSDDTPIRGGLDAWDEGRPWHSDFRVWGAAFRKGDTASRRHVRDARQRSHFLDHATPE